MQNCSTAPVWSGESAAGKNEAHYIFATFLSSNDANATHLHFDNIFVLD
jgi:hypothetical protein